MVDALETLVGLAKRRGFVYPGSEIYGGLANSWDYGPLGVELKRNIKDWWWERYVQRRDDVVGLDAALIMNPKVWQASGHLATFADQLVECTNCHQRYRVDQLPDVIVNGTFDGQTSCPNCRSQGKFTQPQAFNLMLKTYLGPAEEQANLAYLRPETAQSMFVNFTNVVTTTRQRVPFGIATIGKAFRNEITPGNFIFRTREFEQMEIEYFIPKPKTLEAWQPYFDMWQNEMVAWVADIGLDMSHIHQVEIGEEDRAHYSRRTVDFEFDFPFGRKELYGLAYRTDFDIMNHSRASGRDMLYRDPETGEEYHPHVIEPTWGVDRTALAVLCEAYTQEDDRVVLRLVPRLAPYKVAVFPLLANKPPLVDKARLVYEQLRRQFMVAWDDRGNIGKRYKAQDEIGTPYCVTIDFDTLEDETVTVRDRDSQQQQRLKISELEAFVRKSLQ
jgi:glycyl-tRNA synthetase